MTTAEQRDFVDAQVREAVAQGARALTGGERPVAKGYWFPPTVLVDVNHGMRVMREETFGPVLPIVVVDTLDEAIAPRERLGVRPHRLGLDPLEEDGPASSWRSCGPAL